MQLHGETGAVPVCRIDEPLQAGDVRVFGDADLPWLHLPDRVHDAAGPRDDQPHAAARLLLVKGHDPVAASTVVLAEVDAHRGDHDAVAKLERTDAPGRE